MAELTIGPLKFRSQGNSLIIQALQDPKLNAGLAANEVHELIEFLIALTSNELNRRQSFRVPLSVTSGLRVTLHKGGKSLKVEPKNISLTGLLVGFQSEETLDLKIGSQVRVSLEFEGKSLEYTSVVCRQLEDSCGLFFPESLTGEEIEPPAPYLNLVMELQRRLVIQTTEQTP